MGHLLAGYHGMEGRNKALKSKASSFYFDLPVFYSLEMCHLMATTCCRGICCLVRNFLFYPSVISIPICFIDGGLDV